MFGRAPDAGGFAFWVNELKSGARSLREIADAMVGISPEFTDTYGNLNNLDFVNRLYLNVQDRPGESGGVAFWRGQLDSGALTRGGVVLGFSESPEFRAASGSTVPLDRLYCAFFLRNPDAGGKSFWTSRYLVDELSLGAIAQQFTSVPEFSNLYGPLTDREFVELIYKNVLGRDLPLVEIGGPPGPVTQPHSGPGRRRRDRDDQPAGLVASRPSGQIETGPSPRICGAVGRCRFQAAAAARVQNDAANNWPATASDGPLLLSV